MMKYIIIIAITASFILAACNSNTTKDKTQVKKEYTPITITPDRITHITMNDSVSAVFLARGRKIAGSAKVALKKELKKAIKEGGLEHAVEFCHTRALEITDSISLAEQVIIKRLAMKNRNSINEMTKDESNIYKGYVLNHISGINMKSMVSWDEVGQPVYFNPIITEASCLNCHGTIGKEVNPDIAAKIAELYPDDKATEFKLGDIRGMWSITFPEYMVVAAE